MTVYLGARSGVWKFDRSTGSVSSLGLGEHRFWAIHAWRNADNNDTILAGSYEAGIFRSLDGGVTWETSSNGLSAPSLRTLQLDPTNPGAILAGTEPARAYRSDDGGATWKEFDRVTEIDGVSDWFLPYSPRAGALRNFVATESGQLYASVEVGGLLHSPDGGESWRLIPVDPGPRVHDDIHYVITDPAQESRLFVALGGALVDRTHSQWLNGPRKIGGVAVSEDAGENWTKLRPEYTRAVHIPSARPEWLIAGPAARTGAGGWIVGSTDRGQSWERTSAGIDTPMDDMVERFEEAPDGTIWALCSGGRIFAATPGEWEWQSPLPDMSRDLVVESVSFVDGD